MLLWACGAFGPLGVPVGRGRGSYLEAPPRGRSPRWPVMFTPGPPPVVALAPSGQPPGGGLFAFKGAEIRRIRLRLNADRSPSPLQRRRLVGHGKQHSLPP